MKCWCQIEPSTAIITQYTAHNAVHHSSRIPLPLVLYDYEVWPLNYKGKVKCNLVQALRLCAGRMAHRGSRGTALLFLDHGTRRGEGVRVTPRPLFTPGKEPAPIVQETGWAPGPVWTGAENLAHAGIRSPENTARSQSLYRLSYQAHS